MKKILAVGIIFLFTGVAVAPGITAFVTNNETVRFTVQLCGLDTNYTLQLTRKQAQEVYAVFDTVKQKLSMIETQEGTVAIFSEAINKLHTVGLLGEMEVSRVINLVLQPTMDPRFVHTILARSHKLTNEGNYLCSIAGNTSNAYFCGTSLRMLNMVMTLPFFIFHKLGIGTMIQEGLVNLLEILVKIASPLLIIIDILLGLFDPLILQILIHFLFTLTKPFMFLFYLLLLIPTGWTDIPWILMNIYDFKDWICSAIMIGNDRWGPSVGWVDTVGKNGKVNLIGSLWVQLPLLPQVVSIPQFNQQYFYYPGIMGFRGIKVWCEERQDWSFIGNALWVNLGSEHPRNPWLPTVIT